MKKHYRKENDCLNCGTILEGKFCHNCGQENLQMKETFGHMMNHAISDYFHFDDQFFHTLKPLFFKPGKLTNEYTAGHRAQYLHPVKMYIFISLVYFILLFKNNDTAKYQDRPVNHERPAGATTKPTNDDHNLSPLQLIADSIKANKDVIGKDDNDNSFADNIIKIHIDTTHGAKTYDQYLAQQNKLPASKKDNIIERYLEKKSFSWHAQGKNAKEAFAEELKHNIPKMMFIILPLFALILSLAFYKNKKFYVEHLIFAFHFHCFLFLYLTVLMLVEMLIPSNWGVFINWMNFISVLIIAWYVYTSLRVVYNRGPIRTVTKIIGISTVYSIVFSLCLTIVVLITALIAV